MSRALAVLVVLIFCTPAEAAIRVGFSDPLFDPGAQREESELYFDRATALGAGAVRITARWSAIAPARPRDDAGDPASPAYRFAPLDAAVRAASRRGLQVLLLVAVAPRWAEGADRPSVPAGAWRPDPAAFGAFMHAVAARYSGTFDPADGTGPLPFVPAYQLWNEPNLTNYLAPQWTRARGRIAPASPERYRALVNAAYPQVKAASPRALVVSAGTAPYGDPKPGGKRMAPARFWRALLCETGTLARPRPAACPRPVRLDVFAHHPYGVSDPFVAAYWPDDVTLSELPQLSALWRLAERTGRVLPAGRRPRWVTEFGWESAPDPGALSTRTQALWMGRGLYQIARAGFTAAFWYHIADDDRGPSWGRSVQAGLYTRAGTAKPGVTMYAFPVAAIRRLKGRVTLFAIPPLDGTCVGQRRRPGQPWRTIVSGHCTRGEPWTRGIRAARGSFRVLVAGRVSPATTAAARG